MTFIQQLYLHSPLWVQKGWMVGLAWMGVLYFVQSRRYLETYLWALGLFVVFFFTLLALGAEFLALIFFLAYVSLISVLVIGYISFVENWLQGFQPDVRVVYSSRLRQWRGLVLSLGFLTAAAVFLVTKDVAGFGGWTSYVASGEWQHQWTFLLGEVRPQPHSSFFLFSYYFYSSCKYLFLLVGLLLYVSSIGSLVLLKTQAVREDS